MGLKESLKNEIFSASFVLLILMTLANFINYLFHFVMGRMLGPVDYGVLAFLTSIMYIFGVPTASIQTLVAKYTTKFNVKKEYGKIKGMIKFMILEATLLAVVLFLIFCLISFFFSSYVGISFWLLALTGLILFSSFLSPIGLGVVQGLKKFSILGWNTILGSTIKIILAVFLVLFSFKVYGAILGFILGGLISFIFIFPFIKEIMNSKEIIEKKALISINSVAVLVSILTITLMYSLDIIFAKIFFSADIAGKYAVASMIGKMIFFGTSAVTSAMFPLSSEKFLNGDKSKTSGIIKKTFIFVTILCLIALFFMGLFPKLVISLLFGSKYLEIVNILFYLGVAFSMISLTNTFVLYKLSIEEFRIRHAGILLLFLILQIVLFINFRQSITSFSFFFMISTIVTFFGSILLIKRWKN